MDDNIHTISDWVWKKVARADKFDLTKQNLEAFLQTVSIKLKSDHPRDTLSAFTNSPHDPNLWVQTEPYNGTIFSSAYPIDHRSGRAIAMDLLDTKNKFVSPLLVIPLSKNPKFAFFEDAIYLSQDYEDVAFANRKGIVLARKCPVRYIYQ